MDSTIDWPWHGEMPGAFAAALLLALLLAHFRPVDRATVWRTLALATFGALLALAALLAVRAGRAGLGTGLERAAALLIGVGLIRLAGLALFRLALPALRLELPRILEDVAVVAGYALWLLVALSLVGVELSGLVATSAVITAVLAFAMQDTLGNVLGGLALHLDDSLAIGDWLRVDDVSGQVVQIQWRFTALRTRSGEKVVIPNAQLMKAKFFVIGRRDRGGAGQRRAIEFDVDVAVKPARVIAALEEAMAAAEVANVARDAPASCVAMGFGPGSVRYALRYWLIDPAIDDPTDSAVREHVLATLQRQGWRLAVPDRTVHLVQEDQAWREAAWQRELARRLAALSQVPLFAGLDDDERQRIAGRLVPAPFARGDVMTRQGAAAHWLYLIASGDADVYWEAPDGERRLLTRLCAGSVFGEMGLMTGAPRSATVVAAGDVECYRLDKAGFEDVLHARPALAEAMAHVLSERQQHNEALREELRRSHGDAGAPPQHAAILRRIREFFGLG
ncbi:MAG: mechanosensitive ion channel family protein [Rubrivivax sp.]|nr:mechanosensitive ion channel family protein [Rubrivivax sp.]